MSEPSSATESGFSLRRCVQKVVDFSEPAIVGLIHLCGWSAIIFVMAIFFFVFKESLPAITGLEEGGSHAEVEKLDLTEFTTSPKWIPESAKKRLLPRPANIRGACSWWRRRRVGMSMWS